jgi:iron complex outermembrane receptor protein
MKRMEKSGRTRLLGTVSVSTLGLLAVIASGTAASAQTAAPVATNVDEVVVTATRVGREGYTAPTPMTSIGRDALENQAAVVLSDVLYQLPSVRPAPNSASTSQASGNYLNLRGFGATRTLTLVDGRRFIPSNGAESSGGSSVDLNLIPEALVERIDVVTGGASAAWGSDAVGGVVNLVLRRSLQGVRAQVQYGQSDYGDANTVSANLAAGTSYAGGRGQAMIAFEYSHQYNMPTYGDRDYSGARCAMLPGTVGGVAYQAVKTCGVVLNGYTNGGVIVAANGAPLAANSPLYGRQFIGSTSSSPFDYGQVQTTALSLGGSGGWKNDYVKPQAPLLRKSVYARTLYELTDNITASLDGSYGESGTKTTLFVNSIPSSTDPIITISSANPYIPADIRAIMTANGLTSFALSRLAPELGFATTDSNNRVARLAGGLEGKLGGTWKWDAYATYAHDWYTTRYSNNLIVSNLSAALDVITNPATGRPDCRINVQGPAAPGTAAYGAQAGCVPANPFGVGSLASVASYVEGTPLVQKSDYGQIAAGGTIRGEPFSVWAGPVSTAFGFDYRKEWVKQHVSSISDFVNPPVFASGGFQQSNPKSFSGEYKIAEGFGEIVVPLLADKPFAKSLDLNGAARVTNYSTSGTVATWKFGATWEPVDGILFRAAHSRDIRAAGLFESYGANTTYGTVTTRGAGGVATGTAQVVSPGLNNTNLSPEKALTTTAGVTVRNMLVDRLSMSLDFYRIDLRDTIGKLGAQGIIDKCFAGGTAAGQTADPASCALISNNQTVVVDPYQNLGTIFSDGLEFDASYSLPADTFFSGASGDFSARFLADYVRHRKVSTTGLNPAETAGDEAGVPHWRWNATLAYRNPTWGAALTGRYIGKMTRYNLAPDLRFDDPVVNGVFYLDANVKYTLWHEGARNVEMFVNVKNLLNKDPPFVPSTGANAHVAGTGKSLALGYTNLAFYDFIGRAYTVGMRLAF